MNYLLASMLRSLTLKSEINSGQILPENIFIEIAIVPISILWILLVRVIHGWARTILGLGSHRLFVSGFGTKVSTKKASFAIITNVHCIPYFFKSFVIKTFPYVGTGRGTRKGSL